MVQISEVKNQGRDNRTSAHTHIKGLGLTLAGTADKQAAGFVGQQGAREVSHAKGCYAWNKIQDEADLLTLLTGMRRRR